MRCLDNFLICTIKTHGYNSAIAVTNYYFTIQEIHGCRETWNQELNLLEILKLSSSSGMDCKSKVLTSWDLMRKASMIIRHLEHPPSLIIKMSHQISMLTSESHIVRLTVTKRSYLLATNARGCAVKCAKRSTKVTLKHSSKTSSFSQITKMWSKYLLKN